MNTLEQILGSERNLSREGSMIRQALHCSPFLQRLLASDATLLPELLERLDLPYTAQEMRDWLSEQPVVDETALKRVLRKLRQRVMMRAIVRDLNGLADLDEVMQTMTQLAEIAVQFSLKYLNPWLEALYGTPIGESGQRQEMIVVGMGKLGGGELNVSSDIDLIFAFEEDGETSGERLLSNKEFFTRLGKKLIAAIDEKTEDGFVFRVDMRLRPYGGDGPLACSLDMLEEYYQTQGREWERYAWIKGRVIAGPEKNLADLLRPFVFRKYLDYGAFASMRDLKIQIQREVNRRELHNNIKLGRGGIREIEFIAQVFQLIRGGQDRNLQIRPTLSVLNLLRAKQLLPASIVRELSEAYVFLRNLEHRLQYVEDAQTQNLPEMEDAMYCVALAMGCADWATLIEALEPHRQRVDKHFREVFSEETGEESGRQDEANVAMEVWQGVLNEEDASSRLKALGFDEPEETLRRLVALRSGARYKQLPELSRRRFDTLMSQVIALAATERLPDSTLQRVSDLLDAICRRASYLALLAEYPGALSLVVKLAGASPWVAQYLSRHPILLDELLDTRTLYASPDFSAMRADLERRLQDTEEDVERQMDTMRHFKHAAVLRFAAQDVAGELPLRTLSDYLSALADLILQATLDIIWPTLRGKHCDKPRFAVIGYGKLGGKELSYASDLDIVFLYEDDVPDAGQIYARFGQRINNWLSSLTSAGTLYETDLQLRPDGASGLLVSSVEAFREYQMQKAWVWEHQALTRARFCAGDEKIGQAFERTRNEVLTQPRDIERLRAEVIAMRQKMRDNLQDKTADRQYFDLKHDDGGIIDVEFIVQYLVLAHSAQYPQLTKNAGNIALLETLGELGLIDAGLADGAAKAYEKYRSLQHASRLQGEAKAKVLRSNIEAHIENVRRLWAQLFG